MPTQQLLLRLAVERDCAWERRYHRKIRGRIDQALRGTRYDDLHDSDRAAFTFSDPMPFAPELEAGDDLYLVVASPSVDILRAIAADLGDNPTMTAGSMLFDVRAAKSIEQDVGVPGTSGVVTTGSGVCITVNDADDTDVCETREYWTDRHHDVETFRDALHESIYGLFEHETNGDPPEQELFDEYDHQKTYAVEIDVTPEQSLTVLTSKWDFGYTVRDETHRKRLNTLLAHGVGGRRPYGFGLLQPRNATQAATSVGEGVATHA